MSVGMICYDCHSGLGHLARDFYRHGVVQHALIIPHPHYRRYPNWYPQDICFAKSQREQFLDRIDTLLMFENAFDWAIPKRAKERDIKTVLIPNYEYTPFPPPVTPDLVICASLLDVDYYKQFNHVFLAIPVDQQWRLREKALHFVHNAGHGQRGFAKGTPQIVEAMRHVRSPITLTIRGQPGERRIQNLFHEQKDNPRVKFEFGDFPDDYMYSIGDVFINAEQYNGMSLMLQEARAAGMLVMTTDRYPINTWLPKEPLIPVKEYVKDRICVEFDRAVVDPRDIAHRIDEWYGRDITEYSRSGAEWAAQHSWDTLKPKYLELLNR